MSIKKMVLRIITAAILTLSFFSAKAQFKLDLEGGLVYGTNYNKIRIPASDGSLVNISNDLDVTATVFYRIRAGYTIANRHTISVLYAPLTVKYSGAFDRDVNFNNSIYSTGEDLRVDYKFNSYRITYRYDFIENRHWRVGAGLTAKIRDADVRFKSSANDTHYDNIGFVPLVNFYAAYRPAARWTAILEGDALASKYGRAEDIFLGASYNFTQNFGVKLGYRVVEGGADNDKIYNFTWINYASAGLLITFCGFTPADPFKIPASKVAEIPRSM
jgi:opacity protein-like surface antigen